MELNQARHGERVFDRYDLPSRRPDHIFDLGESSKLDSRWLRFGAAGAEAQGTYTTLAWSTRDSHFTPEVQICWQWDRDKMAT